MWVSFPSALSRCCQGNGGFRNFSQEELLPFFIYASKTKPSKTQTNYHGCKRWRHPFFAPCSAVMSQSCNSDSLPLCDGDPFPCVLVGGICTFPTGLRAGWGFILCFPFPRRRSVGLLQAVAAAPQALCSCSRDSDEVWVVWMHSGEDPPDQGEEGKGMGRAGICKRGPGKGEEKANQAAWERRQWGDWCLVMSMYLTESGKITKCSNIFWLFFCSYFSFSLIFIQS